MDVMYIGLMMVLGAATWALAKLCQYLGDR